MEITTKYITKDDFKRYFGIDLDIKLKDNDNPSDKSNAFLMRVENDVMLWLNHTFNQDIDYLYPEFTDIQKQYYQLALLEQAIYMFKNGDILNDSGYEPDGGKVISRGEIKEIMLSPRTEMYLKQVGLCNRYLR